MRAHRQREGSIACAEKARCITFNDTQTVPNDPDGIGAAPATSPNTGTSLISGLNAPHAGYLTGVFLPAGGASGTLPPALAFTTRQMGTGFSHIAPLLDQTFFIGDGRRGDAKGTRQTFNVPGNATTLVLGRGIRRDLHRDGPQLSLRRAISPPPWTRDQTQAQCGPTKVGKSTCRPIWTSNARATSSSCA